MDFFHDSLLRLIVYSVSRILQEVKVVEWISDLIHRVCLTNFYKTTREGHLGGSVH